MSEKGEGVGGTDASGAPPESVDDKMVCLMRLVLSLSALVIIYVDPSEPNHFVATTYTALALYLLYSAALYLFPAWHDMQAWERAVPWVDVACYLILISLSSGTNSVFFFFFFFAILVASFRHGFRAGLSVTVASAVSFIIVGYFSSPPYPDFQWNRFLLRPTYLLVLGYMMAYWGGRELRLKRQLNLLKEVTGLANPRFGIAHTLITIMKRLRAFYDADSCLLVWSNVQAEEYYLITCEGECDECPRLEKIPEPLARLLTSLPENLSVVYNGRRTAWQFREMGCYYTPAPTQVGMTAVYRTEVEALAERLDAEGFISVPAIFREHVVGRLYLAGRRGVFDRTDVEFLKQIVEQVRPVLENIRLLERLASNAAEQERQRLARDIHDSVIQPYIGLQYRLAAIHNKLAAHGAEGARDVGSLLQSTVEEVKGLRGFVRGLKDSGEQKNDLAAAVRRFAAQFSEDYHIEVQVECAGQLNVNYRLAAEMIRFVHEGLSNVRKHTQAAHAVVRLECLEKACLLRIENDGTPMNGDETALFTPKSIVERARELGGRTRIERVGEDRTAVTVEIPL